MCYICHPLFVNFEDMKRSINIVVAVSFFVIFLGCIEKNGYYGESGNAIITNLTEKEWNRQYHSVLSDGTEIDIYASYVFKKNGQGIYKEKAIYVDGKQEERISYFHWTFTTPNFKYIYLDLDCFWEIVELTSSQLCIYETWDDPLEYPNQHYKNYQEYTCNMTN